MRVFDRLVPTVGKFFTIIRCGKQISRVKGIYQTKNQIDLPFDADVKVGDQIYIESLDEIKIVTSIEKSPVVMGEGIDHLRIYFNSDSSPSSSSMSITINGNAIGSAFGRNAVSNYTVYKTVEQTIIENGFKPEDFKEILDALKEAMQNNDCKKGFLSKFSDTLSKHSWLSGAIAQELFRYFVGSVIR